MNIDEMKKRKIELGYSNKQLADITGIPIGTLQKVFSGETKTPRRDTIAALEKALKPDNGYFYSTKTQTYIVRESVPTYNAQKCAYSESDYSGSYTIDDYFALPDDKRVELIDGVFYDMASPSFYHQFVGGYLYSVLLQHVMKNNGPCYPFMAPCDVQLDRDNKTIVQPDVLILCDKNKKYKNRVYGAPDFVCEVLSPSTRRKDMTLKYSKYSKAGVREYWIIDPQSEKIVVYDFEHDALPTIYAITDKVPVKIWNGECVVDFKPFYDKFKEFEP